MPQILYTASDHAGFKLKENFKVLILASKLPVFQQLQIVDLSPEFIKSDDYPLVAKKLATKILNNSNSFGLAICGSGEGICMALNRFNGVRAGLSNSKATATLLRQHNHAQVLCLSGLGVSCEKKLGLLKSFLEAKPSHEERHLRRIIQLDNLTT